MVSDVIETTKQNIRFYKINNLKDIYRAKNQIVHFKKNENI